MQPSPPRPSAEALLAHVEWVRRLARLLVADAQDAADVEQETWRQALERPPAQLGVPESSPGADRSVRHWLAAVARNVARKLVRSRETRERHERIVVAASTSSAAHEVTARAELHRRVVDTVLALEELYKAPLLLRFFDDLPAQEVARRLGVPVETARTRIKRGLALVRERLGRELGCEEGGRGGRASSDFLAAMAPLLLPRGTAASVVTVGPGAAATATVATGALAGLVMGGAFMSKLGKIAAGLLVAGAALFGSYKMWVEPGLSDRPVAGASDDGRDRLPAPAEVAAVVPAPAATNTVREPVDGVNDARAKTPAATLGAIEGTVLDGSGRPVAGATVVLDRVVSSMFWDSMNYLRSIRQFLHADGRDHTWRGTKSGSDGTFRFDDIDPRNRWALGALHDPLGTGWNDAVVFVGDPALARVALVLRSGVVLFGSVRDPLGNPVAVASVTLHGSAKRPDEGDNGWGAEFEDFVNTDEDGSYRSLPLPWRHVKVHVYIHESRPDLAQLGLPWEELPTGTTEVRRDLTMPSLTLLRGRILGLDGKPARLAQTIVPRLGPDARRTQSKATIAVAAFAEDPRLHPELVHRLPTNEPGLVFLDSDYLYGALSIDDDRYEIPLRQTGLRYVAIVARDELLGVAEIPQPPTGPDVTIDPSLLPERSLVHGLRLHFRDASDGSPLSGVHIWAIVNTRDANGGLGMAILNFGPPKELPPDRELELPLMPCSIQLAHDGFAPRTVKIDASRSGAPTELTIDFFRASASLDVHVEDEGGVAIAGAWTRVYRGSDHEPVMTRRDNPTDEHGECNVAGLPAGDLVVVVQKEGYVPAATMVSASAPVAKSPTNPTGSAGAGGDEPIDERFADLVIERGYEFTLQVKLPDGTPATWGLVVLANAAGLPLYDDLHPQSGPSRLSGRKLRLTDGTYTIRCIVPGAFEGSATFIAAPAATIEVVLAPIE